MTPPISTIEQAVLVNLLDGPHWRRAVGVDDGVIDGLSAAGLIERCHGSGKIRYQLTPAGRRAAGAHRPDPVDGRATNGSNGYSFRGAKAQVLTGHLGDLARANARRRPCPHCNLLTLPESQDRHNAICHEEAVA